ncbi:MULTISPECIES: hypothetical protein [Bacillus]|uniref:hypothetical protein n=1 Tax=Bacillus TaxID=1386 RepID=UPI000694BF17|nr:MULTISPECIES: hypothetical protein [Bacillus]KOA74477.1 hypothetical protein ACR53_15500 [Bacillus stratosphericus]MBR3379026.1 hypothetical protein [Bacillus sp. (in: firmicutes)]MDH8712030.1 hypothetical protein [Micromonospora sp. 1209]CVN65625.1 Uncharacterised protein [Streptococcus pneumoniae]BAT47820.1 uncharacterized protein BTUAT1_06860 [Bacillus pumilus]
MKKIILSSIVILVFTLGLGTKTYAASDMTGTEYVHVTTTKSKKTSFTHTATNPSNKTDRVSYSVSTTKSTNADFSASYTLKLMVHEVGIKTQIGLGLSKTEKITMTWSIPPKSTYKLTAGTKFVKESGVIRKWNAGKILSSKSVSAKWSYGTWSKKVKK